MSSPHKRMMPNRTQWARRRFLILTLPLKMPGREALSGWNVALQPLKITIWQKNCRKKRMLKYAITSGSLPNFNKRCVKCSKWFLGKIWNLEAQATNIFSLNSQQQMVVKGWISQPQEGTEQIWLSGVWLCSRLLKRTWQLEVDKVRWSRIQTKRKKPHSEALTTSKTKTQTMCLLTSQEKLEPVVASSVKLELRLSSSSEPKIESRLWLMLISLLLKVNQCKLESKH